MRKLTTFFFCMTLATMSLHAELWLEENFNYPEGNLEQEVSKLELKKWMCSLKAADALGVSPQVADHNLSYPGYVASGKGKVAVLDAAVGADANTQRISVYYMDTVGKRDTVSMYAAFLLKPLSTPNTSGRDLAVWEGSSTGSQVRGRLFMLKPGSTATTVQLGISKNQSKNTSSLSPELAVGSVNLIVMKYEYHPGPKNDVVKLWVNPSLKKTEEEQPALVCSDADISGQTDMIVRGFGLRQRGNGAEIGGLRIATTWAEAVKNDGSEIPDQPEVDPDVYAVEDFDYESGSAIEGKGGWVVSTATVDQGGKSPQIGEKSLSYAGYGSGEKGGALVLDSIAQEISGDKKRNTVMPFASGKLAADETVYTALLVNMSDMGSTSGKELFTYLKQGANNGDNTTMRGRVVVKIAEGMKQFGIKKNSQTIENWSAATPKEETALLIVKYVNKSTSSTTEADEFYLYVNPDPSKSEADNAALRMEAVGNEADGGADLRYIAFRQMKLNATIDGIRVAKNWEKAVNYKAADPDPDPDPDPTPDPTPDPDPDSDQGVDYVQSDNAKYTKVLCNGVLLIQRDGKTYNAQGQLIIY
jgi:hypothetical protein